mmetsp:Transcript_6193/g.5783  ORF Transcript_6193/g.5783 Transcript_6193/m.5783 type:complete len:139 (-) Transcript_6193:66-482(-)
MHDDYNRKKNMRRNEKMKNRNLDVGNGFKNVVRGNNTFGLILDEYGEDKLNIVDKPQTTKHEVLQHPAPWKYNNESRLLKKTLNEVPPYIDQKTSKGPIQKIMRKQNDMPWYYTYNRRSEPSDSILHHFKNKKRHIFL